MEIKKRFKSGVSATILAVAGLGITSSAAASCTLGDACTWTSSSYTGTQSSYGYDQWTTTNYSNSVWARGYLCEKTSFRTGNSSSDSYFTLYSHYHYGKNYRDANLSDGAGFGPYNSQNWKDKIRYVRFFEGPNCV